MSFWLAKLFYQKKDLLQKIAVRKRFKYLLLDKELKAQTDIAKKQYQKLGNTYEFDKIIIIKKNILTI